jgi:hypothetical protein
MQILGLSLHVELQLGQAKVTYGDVANVVDEYICCLIVSLRGTSEREADLEVAVNDVSRVKILHS